MNTLEDRLRDALRERAAHSPIDPDAWQHVRARNARRQMPRRHQWPAKYLVPAIAAAAVAAIILAAHAVTGPRPGDPAVSRSTPAATATASPAPGPGPDLLIDTGFVPPRSGIIRLHYTPPGNTAQYSPPGADRGTVTADFYTGYRSKVYWFPNISTGLQFCADSWHAYSTQPGSGHTRTWTNQAEECEPAPSLIQGQLVRVTGGTDPGRDEGSGAFAADVMRQGIAARQVASVTAVLPDGRSYQGAVGSARGLAENAWSVMYPADGAVHLVFRDAAGREVTSLIKPANPVVPRQGNAARPASGGIRLAGGATTAYLVEGRVALWSKYNGWPTVSSPYRVDSGPALAAVYAYDKIVNVGALPGLKNREEFGYFGYARANVIRVVLRLQGPTGHTTIDVPTIAAGWRGTSVRLWSVQQPWNAFPPASSSTATAYDATGRVVAVVQIGTPAPAP